MMRSTVVSLFFFRFVVFRLGQKKSKKPTFWWYDYILIGIVLWFEFLDTVAPCVTSVIYVQGVYPIAHETRKVNTA